MSVCVRVDIFLSGLPIRLDILTIIPNPTHSINERGATFLSLSTVFFIIWPFLIWSGGSLLESMEMRDPPADLVSQPFNRTQKRL
jgi:hypothetical protein